MFSVQMVFCHKRGRVIPSVSVQLTSHRSPEGRQQALCSHPRRFSNAQGAWSLPTLSCHVIISKACSQSGVPPVLAFSRSWHCPGLWGRGVSQSQTHKQLFNVTI